MEYEPPKETEDWYQYHIPARSFVSVDNNHCSHNWEPWLTTPGSTTGVSIVRVVAIASKNIDESDVTWDFAPSIIWSTIELCVGIMCSCLPVIAPLVRLVFGKVVGLSRGIKAKLANTHPSSIMLSRPSHRDRNFSRLEDNAANLHQGRSNEGVTDGNAVQLKNIYISDDIDIDSRPEG